MQSGCCKSRCHICFPGRQLGKEEETRLALSISLDVEANPLPEAPTADFLLVSVARTGHMAAPSCMWLQVGLGNSNGIIMFGSGQL